ncbi:MAG: HAMP domain-containing protein [Candidatus Omnitrophica bacterium]|nr:HAMP domain-containing protein [Candidatus Omnitrophota bacterium]
MQINSIRFKSNVLYALILAAILSVFGSVIFYAVHRMLYNDLDELLGIKAREVADIIHAYEQAQNSDNDPLDLMAQLFGHKQADAHKRIIDDLWSSEVKTLNLKDDFLNVLTSRGRLILSSENVKATEERLFASQFPFVINKVVFKDLEDNGQHLRAINFPLAINDQLQLVIQLATPLSRTLHILDKLSMFIILAILGILILTSFLGSLFARRVLMPVKEIAETANNISHKELNVRVKGRHADEEIRYLVDSFNTMLARLEKSFTHINEFSSHVAHELKTPLAVIRGEIELALGENHNAQELRKVLQTSMAQVNRVIRIVKDLLLLANLDYRVDIFKFETIDLVPFIREIGENGKILAKEKDIDVTVKILPEAAFISGDKVHLRRLFFNLIHNAVKFTPSGGTIIIVFQADTKSAVVSVSDTGIGIAQEDMSKLFTKFFRVPKAQGFEGTGLGLNIAQAIAQAHQGEISVQSQISKGSTFSVSLPLV